MGQAPGANFFSVVDFRYKTIPPIYIGYATYIPKCNYKLNKFSPTIMDFIVLCFGQIYTNIQMKSFVSLLNHFSQNSKIFNLFVLHKELNSGHHKED